MLVAGAIVVEDGAAGVVCGMLAVAITLTGMFLLTGA